MQKLNYPLIVSDFDGTLVKRNGTVSGENMRAISDYVNAGGIFALSTGRMPAGILPRAKELGLCGIISCCQGAILLDIQSQEILLEGRISYETTFAACKKMEEMGLHIHVYDLWEYYSNMDDGFLKYYENAVGCKAKVILDKPISQFVKEKRLSAYKILAMVNPQDNQRVLDELAKENFDGCHLTRSADILVEVVQSNYSKGTAVEFLAKRYGIPMEKTVAVGDQLNDVSMIVAAGVGIAVQNADEGLKKQANYICEYTNEENAIASVIQKFGFYEGGSI